MKPFFGEVTSVNDEGTTLYRCHRPGCQTFVEERLQCTRCKAICYCSKACQAVHWKTGHRDVCMPPSTAPAKSLTIPSLPCGLCYMTLPEHDQADMSCKHSLHKACWARYQREYDTTTCPFCEPEGPNAKIFVQAMGMLQRNRREELELSFRKHLEKHAEDTVVMFALSRLIMLEGAKKGKVSEEVMKLLLRMIELSPDDAGALLVTSQMYLVEGDFNNASLCLRKADKASPEDVDILTNLGKSLYCQGKQLEALGKLEQAYAIHPTSPLVLRYLYTMRRVNGKIKEVRKMLPELSSADSEQFNDDFMSLVAALHNKLPRASEFKNLARLLLALPPNTTLPDLTVVATNIGVYLAQTPSEFETSMALIKLALQREPKFKTAIRALFNQYLRKIRRDPKTPLSFLQDGTDTGRWYAKCYPKEIGVKVDVAVLIQRVADVDRQLSTNERKKRYAEAEGLFKAVLEEEEGHDRCLHFYALLLIAERRNVEAATMLRKLIDVKPDHPSASKLLKQVETRLASTTSASASATLR